MHVRASRSRHHESIITRPIICARFRQACLRASSYQFIVTLLSAVEWAQNSQVLESPNLTFLKRSPMVSSETASPRRAKFWTLSKTPRMSADITITAIIVSYNSFQTSAKSVHWLQVWQALHDSLTLAEHSNHRDWCSLLSRKVYNWLSKSGQPWQCSIIASIQSIQKDRLALRQLRWMKISAVGTQVVRTGLYVHWKTL